MYRLPPGLDKVLVTSDTSEIAVYGGCLTGAARMSTPGSGDTTASISKHLVTEMILQNNKSSLYFYFFKTS